ncbi:MAG TPA: hypothetical protein VGM02_04695 [Acidobacteriaceae bacterium]
MAWYTGGLSAGRTGGRACCACGEDRFRWSPADDRLLYYTSGDGSEVVIFA